MSSSLSCSIPYSEAPLMLPSDIRSLFLERTEELGFAPSSLPLVLEELARWLPSATLEAFLADLEELFPSSPL